MASRRTPDSSRTAKSSAASSPTTKRPEAESSGGAAPVAARPKRASAPKTAKAAPAPAKAHVSDDMRRAMIAEAAYLRAERRGFAPGGEVEDWVAAEREVDALLNAGTGTGPQ